MPIMTPTAVQLAQLAAQVQDARPGTRAIDAYRFVFEALDQELVTT